MSRRQTSRAERPPRSRATPHAAPPAIRQPSQPRPAVAALAVFVIALFIRVLHVWQIHRAPFFDLKLGDAAAYDAWARRIAAGEWVGRDVFYQAPLYPYALAVVYRLGGTSTMTVRLLQAALSAASCALLAGAGRRLFSASAGLAAGLMLATYPPAIFLDTLIQKSVLDLFFLCLALWLIGRLSSAPRPSSWWQLGAALGCLSLTRENAMVLVAPIAISLAMQRSSSVHRRIVSAAAFAAGLVMILAPVAARNAIVGHELFVTTAQFGPNFYIGNNEGADGTYKPLRPFRERAVFERQDATALAEQARGRRLTPGEVSSYYTVQAMSFVRTHPIRWVRLLARKFALTWNAVEIADSEDQYTYARWSWPVALGAIWNLGLLAPLAAAGIWVTASDWRRLWVLHAMLAAYVASIVLFYVFARYRFPIVPMLMLFAGAGVAGIARHGREQGTRRLAACAAVVGAVAVLCQMPMVAKEKLEAATHFNVGVDLEALGREDEALAEYDTAVDLDPSFAAAHNNRGLLLARRGRVDEATAELEQAVRLSPSLARAHNNLAVMLSQQQRIPEAMAHLEDAVRLDPTYADARLNFALLLAQTGQIDQAIAALHRVSTLAPGDQRRVSLLASLFATRGRLDAAASALDMALRTMPNDASLHNNLGTILAQQGDLRGAAAEFERAATLNPHDAQIQHNLDRLRRGR